MTTGSTQYPAWGLRWDHDRFGNRLAQAVTAGTAPSNSVSVDATTNRLLAPYAYDAAGNMTNDGLNTLTYDAENRLITNTQAGATTNYTYDGSSFRVKKQISGGTTTLYLFSGTKVVAEYDNGAALGSPSREYIYSGSALLATIEAGAPKYHIRDHLSIRVNTDPSGNVLSEQGHMPFGEAWYQTASPAWTSKWKFTSYERDPESASDYAMFRYYVNRLGRFSAPDPIGSNLTNPQSLNRYAYVRNDPVNLMDPLGLIPSDPWPGIRHMIEGLGCSPVDFPVSNDWFCPDQTGLGSGAEGGGGGGSPKEQIKKEYAAYLKCRDETIAGKLAASLTQEQTSKMMEQTRKMREGNPFGQNPFGAEPKDPSMGPGGYANAAMGGWLDTAKDCFKEHPLAGLDSRFHDLDIGLQGQDLPWPFNWLDKLN